MVFKSASTVVVLRKIFLQNFGELAVKNAGGVGPVRMFSRRVTTVSVTPQWLLFEPREH